MTADEQRTIGRLEAEIESLQKQMAKQEAQNVQIMTDLREIRETLASAKGGWRTLIAVAGLSSVVGGALVKLAPILGNLPK
jgi:hypothetical protein